jgi:hypothetical protein
MCIARRGRAGLSPVKLALKFLQFVTLVATALSSPAQAATEIMWWHAMSGQLGKQLEKLAADFNTSQSDLPDRAYVQGQLHRDGHGRDLRVPLAQPARDRSGQ